jgi:hypothetical protein
MSLRECAVHRLPMKRVYEPKDSTFLSECVYEVTPFNDRQRHGTSIYLVTCIVDVPLTRHTPSKCSQHIQCVTAHSLRDAGSEH